MELTSGGGELTATVLDTMEGGNRKIQFHYEGIFLEVLERLGKMPLPPYIKAELEDNERYQTVYSGSWAAPPHPPPDCNFHKGASAEINAMGVRECFVTLHVGLGTLLPG